MAALNHPNVAAIYGLEESNGRVALALVDGIDAVENWFEKLSARVPVR